MHPQPSLVLACFVQHLLVLSRWSAVVSAVWPVLTTEDKQLSRIPRETASFRSSLSDLLLQTLADIANALVLVGIGRTQRAHLGRNLPYLLPIDPVDGEAGLLGIDG